MKSVILASSFVALSTLAAASPGRHRGHGWRNDRQPYLFSPFDFTSTYHVTATPRQVYNTATPPTSAPGEPGAIGYYNYGINADLDTICYNITLLGVSGDYKSLANTATHIHEARRGLTGPPRIAFPDPIGDDNIRVSVGCLTGPFTTGIIVGGVDTGTGFMVSQIEDNPSGFYTDSHTVNYVPGVVRGQLS
jgi:hypothetical protein